jgi:hypothetical protein
MATLDLPGGNAFGVSAIIFSPTTPKSAWVAPFTGQVQSISHLGDRFRAMVRFRPCSAEDGANREAFFIGMASSGDWVRLPHWRQIPNGTMRGSPTVGANAAAGAKTLVVNGQVGDTLLGGDVLGVNNQLIMVSSVGAVASGGGVLSVPLAVPLRKAVSSGAAVTWSGPLGTFQLADDVLGYSIGRAGWHAALEVNFVEAY